MAASGATMSIDGATQREREGLGQSLKGQISLQNAFERYPSEASEELRDMDFGDMSASMSR